MIARIRTIDRVWLGIALAAAMAIAGPFGLAVGFHSHPVGTHSHPVEVPRVTLSKWADEWNTPVGGTNGYTINGYNYTGKPAVLTELVDTLPEGFTYLNGSTSGEILRDPIVDGRKLRWRKQITVRPWSGFSIHFEVRVSNRPGVYRNVIDGKVRPPALVFGSGPTAQIVVGVPTELHAQAALIKGDALRLKFSARLTSRGRPLGGQIVDFRTGAASGCYAYTNSDGVAECTGVAPLAGSVASLGYDAAFEPWYGIYAPSYDHGDLIE